MTCWQGNLGFKFQYILHVICFDTKRFYLLPEKKITFGIFAEQQSKGVIAKLFCIQKGVLGITQSITFTYYIPAIG